MWKNLIEKLVRETWLDFPQLFCLLPFPLTSKYVLFIILPIFFRSEGSLEKLH